MELATNAVATAAEAEGFLAFWAAAGENLWFGKDDEFDRRLREQFLALHEAAAKGELEGWQSTPRGALALVLLLDQFPRNAFRGSPRMFATDPQARSVASRALAAHHDARVEERFRVFFGLPFSHSESVDDQKLARDLRDRLASWGNAQRHLGIIERFRRFPHRNAILGRETTIEEQLFLEQGGFKG